MVPNHLRGPDLDTFNHEVVFETPQLAVAGRGYWNQYLVLMVLFLHQLLLLLLTTWVPFIALSFSSSSTFFFSSTCSTKIRWRQPNDNRCWSSSIDSSCSGRWCRRRVGRRADESDGRSKRRFFAAGAAGKALDAAAERCRLRRIQKGEYVGLSFGKLPLRFFIAFLEFF